MKPYGVNGLWLAYAFYRDYDGVSRRVVRFSDTKRVALAKLQDALRDRAHQSGEITADTRLRDVAALWLAERRTENLAYRTMERYEYVVRVLDAAVGELRVGEVTAGRLNRTLQEMAARAPANARTSKSVLAGILGLAVRHDAITHNPVDGVKPLPVVHREVRAMSPSEFGEFRKVFAEQLAVWKQVGRRRPGTVLDVLDFLIGTGVRPSEALAVRWADVDFVAGTVEINGTMLREKGTGLTVQEYTKTGDDRRLRFPGFVRAMLERRRALPEAAGGMVFWSEAGSLYGHESFGRTWREVLAGTGFEWVTPKVLRKSVATVLARELGSKAAASQLGHTSDVVTLAHYIERERPTVDYVAVLDAFNTASKPPVEGFGGVPGGAVSA